MRRISPKFRFRLLAQSPECKEAYRHWLDRRLRWFSRFGHEIESAATAPG